MLRIITNDIAGQPVRVSVVLLTYKRPEFLKECLKSLQKNAGISNYEILIWDNSKRNIGAGAMPKLLDKARGRYFVVTSDDVLWYSLDWLKILIRAFEQKPGIDILQGWLDEWGALGLSGLQDKTTNSGMWPEKFKNKVEYKIKDIWYWGNVVSHIGAVIFKTQLLKDLNAFPLKPKHKHYIHSYALYKVMETRRMVGQLRDVYSYEACSPYWYQLYPKLWEEKQRQSVEQGMKDWGKYGFDFNDKEPIEAFKSGKFQKYATALHNRTCKL